MLAGGDIALGTSQVISVVNKVLDLVSYIPGAEPYIAPV
jgi:hypothetical protein